MKKGTRPTKHRAPGMTCPDCGGASTQRTGRAITALVREVAYRCENDACGTGFVAQIATIRITQRSAAPKQGSAHLPFAPHLPPRIAANDRDPIEPPPAANDTTAAMTG